MFGYAQAELRKPVITGNGADTVFDFPEGAVIFILSRRRIPLMCCG